MLQKGFLKNQPNGNIKHRRIALLASNTLLYLGAIILVSAFIYLFFNLDKSDSLIGLLLPFMVAGLGLVFVSQLIKRGYKKLSR